MELKDNQWGNYFLGFFSSPGCFGELFFQKLYTETKEYLEFLSGI